MQMKVNLITPLMLRVWALLFHLQWGMKSDLLKAEVKLKKKKKNAARNESEEGLIFLVLKISSLSLSVSIEAQVSLHS